MKDVVLVIAVLAAVGMTVVVARFNEKTARVGKSLEEERYGRMVAEEGLQKSAARLASLEAQIRSADAKMSKVQDILDQEQKVNTDLKKQYEQLAATKAELESKLKATLEDQGAEAAVAANALEQQPSSGVQ